MPILFCNVGWMEYYNGIDGDFLKRGGSHNDHSIGHEVCNFTKSGRMCYGYVQSTGRMRIEKIGAKKDAESVDGVTVVWTAGPDAGGTAVVGWYENATVYRESQSIPNPSSRHLKNGIDTFRISALAKNCRLLSLAERVVMIPRGVKGGIGHSNVWYADRPESAELVAKVLRFIGGSSKIRLPPDVDLNFSSRENDCRLITHLRRERNPKIVRMKKAEVLAQTGALRCCICDFDFKPVYGVDFCEVHHIVPLSKADGVVETTLDDLAIVCSNCHRILHLGKSMPSLKRLREDVLRGRRLMGKKNSKVG